MAQLLGGRSTADNLPWLDCIEEAGNFNWEIQRDFGIGGNDGSFWDMGGSTPLAWVDNDLSGHTNGPTNGTSDTFGVETTQWAGLFGLGTVTHDIVVYMGHGVVSCSTDPNNDGVAQMVSTNPVPGSYNGDCYTTIESLGASGRDEVHLGERSTDFYGAHAGQGGKLVVMDSCCSMDLGEIFQVWAGGADPAHLPGNYGDGVMSTGVESFGFASESYNGTNEMQQWVQKQAAGMNARDAWNSISGDCNSPFLFNTCATTVVLTKGTSSDQAELKGSAVGVWNVASYSATLGYSAFYYIEYYDNGSRCDISC